MNKRRSLAIANRSTSRRVRPHINYLPWEEVGRKELLTGLTVWLVIDVVSLLILPPLTNFPKDELKNLIWPSIAMGIGGAFLLAVCSRMSATAHRHIGNGKSIVAALGIVGGVAGIAGILYPFIRVAGEFLSKTINWG